MWNFENFGKTLSWLKSFTFKEDMLCDENAIKLPLSSGRKTTTIKQRSSPQSLIYPDFDRLPGIELLQQCHLDLFNAAAHLIEQLFCQVPAMGTRSNRMQGNILRAGLPMLSMRSDNTDIIPIDEASFTCDNCSMPDIMVTHSQATKKNIRYVLDNAI